MDFCPCQTESQAQFIVKISQWPAKQRCRPMDSGYGEGEVVSVGCGEGDVSGGELNCNEDGGRVRELIESFCGVADEMGTADGAGVAVGLGATAGSFAGARRGCVSAARDPVAVGGGVPSCRCLLFDFGLRASGTLTNFPCSIVPVWVLITTIFLREGIDDPVTGRLSGEYQVNVPYPLA
jgi:hypothetical protein